MTESRVSQLHTKAVLRLRSKLAGELDLMEPRGFFASLFDISFTSLITTRVIKVLYVLALIGIGVGLFLAVVGAFSRSAGAGMFALVVLAPLFGLLLVVYTRVILELILVLFRIAEHTRELVELTRGQVSPGIA